MPAAKQAARPFQACIRCARTPAVQARGFTSTAVSSEEAQVQKPQPSSKPTTEAAKLDPNTVITRRDEKKLIKSGVFPIGSRRRRAALQQSQNIPFEQLPYQCFQEARKILKADREEKLQQIQQQRERIARVEAQDPTVSGGESQKSVRLTSMRNHLEELKILADINDPIVKKRFEDGKGDMNKPIYRLLAERKWREYKHKLVQQRVTQMNVIPDVLPAIEQKADVSIAFGRRNVQPGDFVASSVSEVPATLKVRVFNKGERLVAIAVIDSDVPNVAKDGFDYRCHYVAANIPIAPTKTHLSLEKLSQNSQVVLPWLPPFAQKGSPYHRFSVFVLEQPAGKTLNVADIKGNVERDGFVLRSFVDKYELNPVGINMFRTVWDENTDDVMKRAGIEGADIEFKNKKPEKLPYKKKDGNYDFGDLEPLDTSIHRGFQNGLRPSHPIDHPASSASMPLPAKAAAPETTRVVPSKLHLALAIAVVQSKPAELTVEDYILRLREHVLSGRQVHNDDSRGKRLNPAGYWAQKYEESKAAQVELETKVTECEREIERLRSELRVEKGARTIRVTPTTRRRKDAPSSSASSRTRKRPRLEHDISDAPSMETVDNTLPEDTELLSAVSAAKSKESIPAPVLASYDNELISTFEATARIFMSLLYGLKRLNLEKAIPEDYGAVVHSLVSMFSRVLDTASEVTSNRASYEAAAMRISNSERQMVTRRSQKIIINAQPASLVIRLLSNFLTNVLTVPTENGQQNQELLEGFLFVLFRRLGNRIYLCTFGHQKCDEVEDDISAWPDPAEARNAPPDMQKQIDETALNLELPILITLLERGLAVAQHQIAPLGTTPPHKQNKAFQVKSGAKSSLESLKSGLSLAARKKLEQSLAHAIFRDETGKDEMMECLTMPVKQALMEPPQKVEQEDVKSWFVEKVWGLVGWQAVLDMR
ncbi:mitochondrial 54S ribosomal protein YmL35 [Botryosphaeria dothidea]